MSEPTHKATLAVVREDDRAIVIYHSGGPVPSLRLADRIVINGHDVTDLARRRGWIDADDYPTKGKQE